jgi:hypothetical protein
MTLIGRTWPLVQPRPTRPTRVDGLLPWLGSHGDRDARLGAMGMV